MVFPCKIVDNFFEIVMELVHRFITKFIQDNHRREVFKKGYSEGCT